MKANGIMLTDGNTHFSVMVSQDQTDVFLGSLLKKVRDTAEIVETECLNAADAAPKLALRFKKIDINDGVVTIQGYIGNQKVYNTLTYHTKLGAEAFASLRTSVLKAVATNKGVVDVNLALWQF